MESVSRLSGWGNGVSLKPARRAAHGNQVRKAIAAVDVHAVRDRAEAVGRVQIAIHLHRPRPAPQPFIFVLELDAAEIVEVPAFGVDHFAEQALTHDVECHHFAAAVIAVLHHHGVLLELLRRFHQRPAIFICHGSGHFGGRVFAVFHRGEHHGKIGR